MSRVPDRSWRHAQGTLALDRCLVMAVVNVTPDSFHDGGRWITQEQDRPDPSQVVAQCRRWLEQGADLLDIGGESTRPGAHAVDVEHELRRVVPVIRALREDPSFAGVALSVDTRRAAVAQAALAAGASIVNDVSCLGDPDMASVVARFGAGLVINHLRGEPATMQERIEFEDLLGEVGDELAAALDRAEAAGVGREQIVVDPGVGFGKTAAQSAALVGSSALLERRTGRPVLIGASRKRFLATLIGGKPVEQRKLASVTAATVAASHGAAIVRVHDVAETAEALRVQAGIEAALASVSRKGGVA